MTIDAQSFRDTLGRFPTGVTVVTAVDRGGELHGVTVGSFSSLSLDPPLVLFSLDKSAICYPAFVECTHFTVNILAEDQSELSTAFASKNDRPWDTIAWRRAEETGAPRLDGCIAYVHCMSGQRHDGGDHDIFVGGVLGLEVDLPDGRPLIHFGGAYRRLDPDRV